MTTPPSPMRVQLGQELRALREQAGMSGRVLGAEIGVSIGRISRVERAAVRPRRPEVERWLAVTGVAGDEQRRRILDTVDAITAEALAYRDTNRRGRAARQAEIGDLERDARRIRHFGFGLLSGLVQTVDYARAIFAGDMVLSTADTDEAVAARIERQQVLYDSGRELCFLVGEPALWWRPGSVGVQLGQLDRLLTVGELPGVELRVLPLTAPSPLAAHSFIVFDRREDGEPALVHVGHTTGQVDIDSEDEVRVYEELFDALWAHGVTGAELRALVGRVADGLRALEN